MRTVRDIVIVIAVIGVLVVWQTGLGRERIRPDAPVTAAFEEAGAGRAVPVEPREVPVWYAAVGSITSRTRTEVAARVMAAVTAVAVDVGDTVEAEASLLSLDDRDLRARADAARAALAAAEARRTQAAQARDRIRTLVESGAETRAQLEIAEADHDAAVARVRAAREGVTEAEIEQGFASIVAPIAGVVVERRVDPGDLAVPGHPLLVLHDPRDLRIEAHVPERLVGSLAPGDPARVRLENLPGDLETSIEEIVPSVDPLTRTVLVKAAVPWREGLRPGLPGQLRFHAGTRRVVAIPRSEVGADGTVWLRRPDGTIRRQGVRLGRTCEDGVTAEVLAGLSEGDVRWVPETKRVEPGAPGAASGAGVPVETSREDVWSQATGTVRSRTVTRLAPRVMARIRSIAVREGDPVTAEDEVARLDDRDLRARLDSATASMAEAAARLLQAEQALSRTRELLARSVATREQIEAAEADEQSARAMKTAAEERVREAEVALGFARIVSPVSGIVVERLAETGDLAGPGRPLLVVQDPENLRFEAAVPERLAAHLAAGVAVRVTVGAATLDAKIDEIVPAVDPTTRTVLVKAPLPRGEGLRPGLFGRLSFRSGERTALLIPATAVARVGQVELVRLPATEGPARVRYVRTRPREGGLVEVLSGLLAGERILAPQSRVEGR